MSCNDELFTNDNFSQWTPVLLNVQVPLIITTLPLTGQKPIVSFISEFVPILRRHDFRPLISNFLPVEKVVVIHRGE